MTADWQEGWLLRATRIPSPNYGPRPAGADIRLVVIHAISLPPETFGNDCVDRFFTNCLPAEEHPYFETLVGVEVSAHFFIRRDGEVVQFVSADERAWHAGASVWQGQANCNDYSIGIELEGSDSQPYETAQYAALQGLLADVCDHYPITAVAGHCHVAPGRKTDPGPFFEWSRLTEVFSDLDFPPEVVPSRLEDELP